MTRKTARKSRGRPRSAAKADLAVALTGRQDAQAQRLTRQLADLRHDHVAPAAARAAWRRVSARVRARLNRVPGEWATAITAAASEGVASVERALKPRVDALLTALAGRREALGGGLRPARVRMRAASGLASARARGARLQAKWIALRERVNAGKLVPVVDVERTWSARVSATRALILTWPVAQADRLHRAAVLEGEAAVRATLREAVGAAVAEMQPREETPAVAVSRPRRAGRKARARTSRPKRARGRSVC